MKATYRIPTPHGDPAILTADPLNEYGDQKIADLVNACGYLPGWAIEKEPDESMAEALERRYVFYAGQMTGGAVTPEGVYTFPDDPPLYPYIAIRDQESDETMYVYPYAIVAITHPERPQWVSRCD